MLRKFHIFSAGGVGISYQIDNTAKHPKLMREESDLSTGLFRAIQSYCRETGDELHAIDAVQHHFVLLPTQDCLYTLVLQANYDYTRDELSHILETIRDQINERFWDDIHIESFFSNTALLEKCILPIISPILLTTQRLFTR